MRDMADDYALEGVSMTVRGGNLFADLSAASAGEEAFSEIFAQPGFQPAPWGFGPLLRAC